MNSKIMIPLILLVAYIAFFVGAVVADTEHKVILIQWHTVLTVFLIPSILGILVGAAITEEYYSENK